MGKELPSPELLRKLLCYEPETGKLYWLERPEGMFKSDGRQGVEVYCRRWNNRYAGKEALTAIDSDGYRYGRINNQAFKAHRVIWALYHGEWPDGQIDHINGSPSDNRIENLRVVTNQANSKNRKRSSNNKSGITGVSWDNRRGGWRVFIKTDGRQKWLGDYDAFDDAVQTRKDAEVKYGFHTNHGRD